MRTANTLPMVAAALLMLSCLATDVAAAARVSGNAQRLVLEVENADLGEVLAALRAALPIEVSVRGSTVRTLSGTYAGSLERVLMRLLSDGDHDFFLAVQPGGLQLTLLDRKPGTVPATPAAGDLTTAAIALTGGRADITSDTPKRRPRRCSNDK